MASDRPCGTEKIVCIRTPAISDFIRGPGYSHSSLRDLKRRAKKKPDFFEKIRFHQQTDSHVRNDFKSVSSVKIRGSDPAISPPQTIQIVHYA
ncbi:Uncharacterized protein dnm_033300 [Desulfonema magnum]|uniref:Uncharacterized protein n=1 Tax=Desulfonema magnum TaxID=45655 RepID=A0A975GN20_9BACT|nr:Uncharacterized protein dnm_033300 [Desulfonema magnum]